ncbi:MAG: hypothetical protein ISR69_10920 [Gammaproteobacteria bacterium]|nr:hypothetical protein [Gammaproteobacteria bacterium]
MANNIIEDNAKDPLVAAIEAGFAALHEDNNQREDILNKQFELQLKVQDKRNQKWRLGALLGGIAIIVLGYSLHKTIVVFEEDMDTMAGEMVKMSGYMHTMSKDMSEMNGSMGVMSPQMVSMAEDIDQMREHIGSMDNHMTYMSRDMGQMNRAMSPLMGNMQKFVPGSW